MLAGIKKVMKCNKTSNGQQPTYMSDPPITIYFFLGVNLLHST